MRPVPQVQQQQAGQQPSQTSQKGEASGPPGPHTPPLAQEEDESELSEGSEEPAAEPEVAAGTEQSGTLLEELHHGHDSGNETETEAALPAAATGGSETDSEAALPAAATGPLASTRKQLHIVNVPA